MTLRDHAAEIELVFEKEAAGTASFVLAGNRLFINFDEKILMLNNESVSIKKSETPLRLYIDHEVLAVFSEDFSCVFCENEGNDLYDAAVTGDSEAMIHSFKHYMLEKTTY